MKRKNYLLLLFVLILLLLSCFGNKQNATISASDLLHREEQDSSNIHQTIESIKKLIYDNDEYIKRHNLDIVFISKGNFGITGGDNWIIRTSRDQIFIYAINDNRIGKRYNLTSFNLEEESVFNIMQDIPGTHIDNSTSSFGDFNGDGVDEIFEYGFYGRAFEIIVWGFDVEKDDFIPYCTIPFRIIDSEYGPAPVEFTAHKGINGFKVFFSQSQVAGGPGYIYEPNPKNGKWFFYAWDSEKREYVEVGEVVEE
ncbi:MAG: hypothetical protein FWG99_11920 [Treponema sp.]|nr:hypothetical protein [Treponema sp.]